jgi:hypothetical protein
VIGFLVPAAQDLVRECAVFHASIWCFGLFCILCSIALPANASKIFEMIGTFPFQNEELFSGTRAEAMGGANIAGAPEAEAFLLNPATLHVGDRVQTSYGQMEWFGNHIRSFAVAGEWRAWRWGLARNELSIQDLVVRTAFDPAGRTYDSLLRMDLANLSWGFARKTGSHTELMGSVGANLRRYIGDLADLSISANTFDLGTTIGLRFDGASTDGALHAGLAWQNISDETAFLGTRSADVPRPLRVGMSAEFGIFTPAFDSALVQTTLSYARTFRRGDDSGSVGHLGGESIFLERIAIRAGSDGGFSLGETRWGVGVILDEVWMGPIRAHLDWSRVELDSALGGGALDLFSISVALN